MQPSELIIAIILCSGYPIFCAITHLTAARNSTIKQYTHTAALTLTIGIMATTVAACVIVFDPDKIRLPLSATNYAITFATYFIAAAIPVLPFAIVIDIIRYLKRRR